MIYYFSGTGNSKWVAETLANSLHDRAVNIIEESAPVNIEGKIIGLVFPIYAWGAPEVVTEFIKRLEGKPKFTYAVATCGDEAGYSMDQIDVKFHLDSMYSISMPNNYVVGSELESDEVVIAKLKKAKVVMQDITREVQGRKAVIRVNRGTFPWFKTTIISPAFNKGARNTKSFYVTDKCISCGLCARICPTKTITMNSNKPHWGDKCYQCLACINRCPQEAIQYGKGTLNRKRYHIEKYKDYQ